MSSFSLRRPAFGAAFVAARATAFALVTLAAPVALHAQDARVTADQQVAQNQLAAARTTLDAALRQTPGDYEILWRASRVQVLLGDEQREGSDAQAQAYQRALDLANLAVKARPKGTSGLVRRAAASGKVALSKGVLQSAELVKSVRDDATQAIATNDAGPQQLAAAHYILGRTHLKLAETPRPLRMPLGLQWGTLADALAQLRKAAELRPDFVMYRLELARSLERDGDKAGARRELERVASLPNQEPGDDARKKEAAQLLTELK